MTVATAAFAVMLVRAVVAMVAASVAVVFTGLCAGRFARALKPTGFDEARFTWRRLALVC
jgi:hypothetical protein